MKVDRLEILQGVVVETDAGLFDSKLFLNENTTVELIINVKMMRNQKINSFAGL